MTADLTMTDEYDEGDNLWGDIDFDEVQDDPFFKPDDTYRCRITEAVQRKTNAGNPAISITYTILRGEYATQRIQEFKTFPFPWQLKGFNSKEDWENEENFDQKLKVSAGRQMSFIKQRMRDFGFDPKEMNRINPKKLLALPPMDVTMVHGKENRENVRGVLLVNDDDDDSTENYDPLA